MLFKVYIPGVGTPFAEIGDNSETLGGATAYMGANRINWAIIQVYNAIHRYLVGGDLIGPSQASKIVGNISSQILQLGFESAARQMVLKTWETRLREIIRGHPRKLLQIDVSVFGFSRGAAQARAFMHWLHEIARSNNDGCSHVLAGVPLRFKFLGIFDTVASVGVAAMSRITEGKMAWADGDQMSIHPHVEQCVHYAALHEQRMNFPLDLARGATVREVLYPGMHSDVGGGYGPGSQGKAPSEWGNSPNLSQVPLIDMHLDALKAGVMLKSIDEIRQSPVLSRAFSCDAKLIAAYNGWLTSHGIAQGNHASQIRAHSRQYLAWKGMRSQNGAENILNQEFYLRADAEDKADLRLGQGWFVTAVQSMQLSLTSILFGNRELLEATAATAPPPAVSGLFDNYVHDSLAGFYLSRFTELSFPGLRSVGYLRYRTVFDLTSTSQAASCAISEPVAG